MTDIYDPSGEMVLTPGRVPPPTPDPTHTGTAPAPYGSYDPDGAATGFLCTLSDVYALCFGVDFRALQRAVAAMQGWPTASVQDWLTGTVIPMQESRAESELGQAFRPTQETRFFDGTGTNELILPFYPVISLDRCVLNVIPSISWYEFTRPRFVQSLGAVNPATDYQDADILVEGHTGLLYVPPRIMYSDDAAIPFWNYTFLNGTRNVQVTWTYGFKSAADVPFALRRAVALRCAVDVLVLAGQVLGEGLAAYKSENVTRIYGRTKDLPYSDLVQRYDDEAKKLLTRFKRVSL